MSGEQERPKINVQKRPKLIGPPKKGPELLYRARCQECGAWLNSHQGFTDGRPYDYRKSGLICEACDAKPKPPPPPSRTETILSNLSDIEADQMEGALSINEAFGLAFQNMKAHVSGERIERYVRAKLKKAGDGWISGDPKAEPAPPAVDGGEGA